MLLGVFILAACIPYVTPKPRKMQTSPEKLASSDK